MRLPDFSPLSEAVAARSGMPKNPVHRSPTVGVSSRQADLPVGAGKILALQRAVGNATVTRLIQGDQDRQDDVGSHPVTGLSLLGDASAEVSALSEPVSPVYDVIGRSGHGLDRPIRSQMEEAFGTDFSAVRVHTGAKAAESARSIGAQAYTVGNDIVLGAGHDDLTTPEGRHLIAHELTHVVQQRSGPVDGTPAPGGIRISDPSDRFEREAEAVAAWIASRH